MKTSEPLFDGTDGGFDEILREVCERKTEMVR